MDRIRIAELSSQAATLQLASLRRNYLIAPASFAHLMQQYLTFQLAVETIFVMSYSEPHHWQTFMIAILIHLLSSFFMVYCGGRRYSTKSRDMAFANKSVTLNSFNLSCFSSSMPDSHQAPTGTRKRQVRKPRHHRQNRERE